MSENDLYERLGVDPKATEAQIKSAYRKLAKELHPDQFKAEDYTEEMKQRWNELKQAHTVLLDRDLRAKYDATGKFDADMVDNLTAKALGNITSAFVRIVNEALDPTKKDLLAELKAIPRQALIDIDKLETASRRKIAKFEKVRGRTKNLKGGSNVLAGACRDVIEKEKEEIAAYIEERRICTRMKEILDEHGFDFMTEEMTDAWDVSPKRIEGQRLLQRAAEIGAAGTGE